MKSLLDLNGVDVKFVMAVLGRYYDDFGEKEDSGENAKKDGDTNLVDHDPELLRRNLVRE
jgi:hypothetical protein